MYTDVIIDVGINRDEDGKLCGDVDREDVLEHYPNAYVTPVPKGVGLLTRVALLQNVYDAYMNGGKDE
jgi:methylenetetrahydrofolate dehydrogenase (NADP+)/methenyltetrahydrofolate cyclohydrolase